MSPLGTAPRRTGRRHPVAAGRGAASRAATVRARPVATMWVLRVSWKDPCPTTVRTGLGTMAGAGAWRPAAAAAGRTAVVSPATVTAIAARLVTRRRCDEDMSLPFGRPAVARLGPPRMVLANSVGIGLLQ